MRNDSENQTKFPYSVTEYGNYFRIAHIDELLCVDMSMNVSFL